MFIISDYLGEGAEEARSSRYLQTLLGLSNRDISRAIETERRAGAPICANCGGSAPGYYLAADRETMAGYCKRLEHREKEIRATRKACEKTLKTLPSRKNS